MYGRDAEALDPVPSPTHPPSPPKAGGLRLRCGPRITRQGQDSWVSFLNDLAAGGAKGGGGGAKGGGDEGAGWKGWFK